MKLAALTISNFGCFDQEGCTIKIDDIVVLIGKNNAGKSTVLDAYEAFASMGAKLPLSAFREENENHPIVIEGVFVDITEEDTNTMGVACVHNDPEYGQAIRVKFQWTRAEEEGEKFTYNGTTGSFQPGGTGGWNTLLQSRIPVPLRIKPTDTPAKLEKIIIDILATAIKQKIKTGNERVQELIDQVKALTEEFAIEIQDEIDSACAAISDKLEDVFPNYSVQFIPDGKLEPDKILGAGSYVRLLAADNPALPLKNQGSGLQRTFLWSAIAALAEIGRMKQGTKNLSPDKPRILLIDEPEAFLHPPMVRSAREALYALAELENWQVMASTHSSVFIDVSKAHTTIIRLERDQHFSTRVISTDSLQFNEEEKTRLAMVRSCNPMVNEFFFADSVLLVEGETEHLVFSALLNRAGLNGKYHIVNCIGKANLPLFAKILNHFQVMYVSLHDSDSPKAQRNGNWIQNGAWTVNANILNTTLLSTRDSYCIAHVPDFEGYYFGEQADRDKPFTAYKILYSPEFATDPRYERLRDFSQHLEGNAHPQAYQTLQELGDKLQVYVQAHQPTPVERWQL